jgi:ATP-dependent DNA helicase RecG
MTEQELNTIIQSGEGYKIEFKRNVNSDLSKELVAFSNSSGGRIFIGIDDDGTLPGVTVDNALRSKVEMIARDCDPSISISLEALNKILIIHVPEGQNKPYRCTGGFYLRNGASAVKLSTEEIRDFFAAEGKVHFDEMPSSLIYPGGLSEEVVKKYMELSGISKVINQRELLVNLGVLNGRDPGRINNTGILFFTQSPVQHLPQSAVTCVAYKGNVKVDILDKKTFELDIIGNIDEAIAFLKRHLNLSYEIKTKKRVEKLEIPEVVLREAIVNAVAHRDYFEKGALVMIEVFDNRLEISNPGGLPKGLKEEDFGKRTLARNPLIAALLNRAGYIEKLGTGIPRIKQSMLEAGLPEPEFKFDSFFTVVLKRQIVAQISARLKMAPKRLEKMLYLLQQLQPGNRLDIAKAAAKYNVTGRSIRKELLFLEQLKLLHAKGSTTNRTYELTDEGKELVEKAGGMSSE